MPKTWDYIWVLFIPVAVCWQPGTPNQRISHPEFLISLKNVSPEELIYSYTLLVLLWSFYELFLWGFCCVSCHFLLLQTVKSKLNLSCFYLFGGVSLFCLERKNKTKMETERRATGRRFFFCQTGNYLTVEPIVFVHLLTAIVSVYNRRKQTPLPPPLPTHTHIVNWLVKWEGGHGWRAAGPSK